MVKGSFGSIDGSAPRRFSPQNQNNGEQDICMVIGLFGSIDGLAPKELQDNSAHIKACKGGLYTANQIISTAIVVVISMTKKYYNHFYLYTITV